MAKCLQLCSRRYRAEVFNAAPQRGDRGMIKIPEKLRPIFLAISMSAISVFGPRRSKPDIPTEEVQGDKNNNQPKHEDILTKNDARETEP